MRILGIILILSVVGFFGVHMIFFDKMDSIHEHKSDIKTLEILPIDKSITKDDAEIIAIENEQLNPNEIYNLHTKKTNYNNIDVYMVEFDANDNEYEYNIEVSTGDVISRECELEERYYKNLKGSPITENDIFKIIKQHVPEVDSKGIYYRLKNEDGYIQYEGYVNIDDSRYEFTIDKNTGVIVEWKWERNINN